MLINELDENSKKKKEMRYEEKWMHYNEWRQKSHNKNQTADVKKSNNWEDDIKKFKITKCKKSTEEIRIIYLTIIKIEKSGFYIYLTSKLKTTNNHKDKNDY